MAHKPDCYLRTMAGDGAPPECCDCGEQQAIDDAAEEAARDIEDEENRPSDDDLIEGVDFVGPNGGAEEID